ncbi:hypothetical protein JW824_02910 [bacterium]|nr:hypothetical protein [bacterium]RQV98297.1 MAG: hypothetical protein EH221_02120 [bacterium]
MMRKNLYYILILMMWLSCDSGQTGLDQFFPGPGFEKGWSWEGKPIHYVPENLYDYINGEAELYHAYGFQECATLTYFWGSPDDTSFVVDIYDMGTPINAFGLYSIYRHPGYRYETIGAEAVVSAFGIKYYQGPYVVELKAGDSSEKTQGAMQAVAKLVSERIPDSTQVPNLITLLPLEGQVDKTLRYTANEMLNQGFLPAGLEATYRIGDEEVMGFVVLFDDAEGAKTGLEGLRLFYEESGDQFIPNSQMGEDGFVVKTKYHGYVVVSLVGQYLAGIQDLSSPDKGMDLLAKIKNNLKT